MGLFDDLIPSGGIVSRATTYSPQRGGDQMEGGYEASRPGPDGQAIVRTLEDFRTGASPYVTVAGNPSYYGRQYTMPEVSYQVGGQRYTLKDVPVVVHDTGGAFKTAPEGRFDVPIARDLGARDTNQGLSGVQFIPRDSAPMAFTGEPARPAGVQAIEGAIRPVPGADPIPPRPQATPKEAPMPATGLFDDLIPAQQPAPDQTPSAAGGAMFDDLIPKPASPQQVAPPKGGLFNNVTAGVNSAIATTLGAPVDAASWLVNKGLSGVEAVTGAELPRVRDPIGGSGSITRAMTALGVNDPAQVQANTTGEKVARAAGEGVGDMIAPEAMLGALNKAGVVGDAAMRVLGSIFGDSKTAANVASNAGVGAAAGAGGYVGGDIAAEAGGEKYRPLGELAGNMIGGIGAAGVGALPRAAGSAARFADDKLLLTQGAQERAAGMKLNQAASDPAAVRDTLDAAAGSRQVGFATEPGAVARNLVEGSEPTTFQLTGDMGLGGLERGVAAKNPEMFQQRTADQNAARLNALGSVQPGGHAEAVTQALRDHLGMIDAESARAIGDATSLAVERTKALGGDMPPESYGAALRGIEQPRVQAAEAEAQGAMRALGGLGTPEVYGADIRERLLRAKADEKSRERAAWEAVDPERSLYLPAAETSSTARRIVSDMPATAKPFEGEEAELFALASGFGAGAVPFRDLDAYVKRLNAAMKQERREKGETPTLARLSQLRAAAARDMDIATMERADASARGEVAAGVSLEETFGDARRAVVGGDDEWPGPVPGRAVGSGGASGVAPGGPSAPRTDAVLNEAADIALGRKAPYRPPSFLKWIERNGGIRYDDNVAAALDAADRRHGNLLNRSGRSVDEWGVSIAERAGWGDRPDQNEILDWISEAANGREPDWWTALHASPDRQDAARLAEHLTRIAAEEGIPLRSRQAALDLLRRDAELYGLGPTDDLRASIAGRSPRFGESERSAYGRAGEPGADMGARSGAGASGEAAGGVGGVRGLAGGRGEAGRGPDAVTRGEGFPVEGPVGSNFDEEALGRLRAAAAATTERAEKFNTAPVGDVLKSRGYAGQFLVGDASVPGRIFQPGVKGFQNVTAFRRAVGNDEAALVLLQDYAISDLRRAATRPDGTLDPRAYERWRDRYFDALRAFPDFHRRVGTAERASRLLDESRIIPDQLMDADVAGRIFRQGEGGFDSVTTFLRSIGDDRARPILEDYAISSLRRAAEVDGMLDPKKVAAWRAKHRDALRAMPDVDARLADPVAASEAIAGLAAARKEALDGFQAGVVGKLLGVDAPQDVTRIIGSIFEKQDAVQQMRRLAKETAGNKDAREGLRKAIADHIQSKFISNTEAATSEQKLIRSDQFQTFVKKHAVTLGEVFSPQEVELMQRIAADLSRSNRSITAVKLPGGSNTAQDTAAIAKNSEQSSILSRMVQASAAAGAGAAYAGWSGGFTGLLGSAAVMAIRNSGIQKVDTLLRDALLHPDLARALLQKAGAKKGAPDISLRQALARVAVLSGADAMSKADATDRSGSR